MGGFDSFLKGQHLDVHYLLVMERGSFLATKGFFLIVASISLAFIASHTDTNDG